MQQAAGQAHGAVRAETAGGANLLEQLNALEDGAEETGDAPKAQSAVGEQPATQARAGEGDLLAQLEKLEEGLTDGKHAETKLAGSDDELETDKFDARSTMKAAIVAPAENSGKAPRKSAFGQAVAAMRERHFKRPVIHVLVHSGRNLPDVLLVGTQDPYVRITVLPTGQVRVRLPNKRCGNVHQRVCTHLCRC